MECQAAHRPYHKTVCAQLAAAAAVAEVDATAAAVAVAEGDATTELHLSGCQDDVADADQVYTDKHLFTNGVDKCDGSSR